MEDFNIGGAKMAVKCADLSEHSWEVDGKTVRFVVLYYNLTASTLPSVGQVLLYLSFKYWWLCENYGLGSNW